MVPFLLWKSAHRIFSTGADIFNCKMIIATDITILFSDLVSLIVPLQTWDVKYYKYAIIKNGLKSLQLFLHDRCSCARYAHFQTSNQACYCSIRSLKLLKAIVIMYAKHCFIALIGTIVYVYGHAQISIDLYNSSSTFWCGWGDYLVAISENHVPCEVQCIHPAITCCPLDFVGGGGATEFGRPLWLPKSVWETRYRPSYTYSYVTRHILNFSIYKLRILYQVW